LFYSPTDIYLEKLKESQPERNKMIRAILLSILAALSIAEYSFAKDGTIWFGRPDSLPLVFRIDSPETVAVWIQTNPDVYMAAVHIPLSSDDRFITERSGGKLLQPFVDDNPPEGYDKGWDSAELRKAIPHKDKEGYTSQGILGFCDLYRNPNVPLHCEKPCRIADFYVHTAPDDSLKGRTFDVFIEGYEYPSQGINVSDTLGIRTFDFAIKYSRVHFLFPGDINADFKIDNADIAYLRLYLERKKEIPFPELRADCNGDNIIDERDLVCLEGWVK
jgi:hypothetical protein